MKYFNEKVKISGVVLSGGNDIGEFKQRDKLEKQILTFCKKKKIPVLGICRGMQMMATYEKIKLVKIKNHVRTRNNLYNKEKKYVQNVNSYHNWTIKKCPKNYEVLHYAEDNSIESIVHKTLKWEGWMWHPEREATYNKSDLKRLKNLFG